MGLSSKIRYFIILFISFLFSYSLFSQNSIVNDYITREWSTLDGLPGNSITDIIQTSDGYLYIGTYDGLARFDGFEFKIFNKYNGDNKCNFTSSRALFEDSKGNLWVGSNDEGLARIGDDETLYFNTETGLPNNSVRNIREDFEGNIWVGTAAGVCYITPDYEIKFPEGDNSSEYNQTLITSLYCDSMGRIIMLTSDKGGIYVYNGREFERYKGFDSIGEFRFTAIAQDNFGNFWIGTDGKGIFRIVDKVPVYIKTNTKLDSVAVWNICNSFSGDTWFGTEKGAVIFRQGAFIEFTKNNNSVNKIIEDREKNIWLGSASSGLQKVTIGRFSMVYLDSTVNAVADDNEGLLWVGTNNGLLCYKNNVPIENDLTKYCYGLRIRHVGITKNGDILVNGYKRPGFIRAEKVKDGPEGSYNIRNWSSDNGLAGNKTRVSIETESGDIYVGTTTGLSIIRPDGSVRTFAKEEGFDSQYIMCLCQDDKGYVWIGTDGDGIYIMKDEKIIDKISSDNGLAGNVVFKIMQDKNNAMWMCTGTGVSYYSDSTHLTECRSGKRNIFNFTGAHGLITDSVFQVIIDYKGTVWMLSNQGIFSIPYDDLINVANGKAEYVDSKLYTQNDGLQSKGVTSTALSARTKDECIVFTMVDGFAIYNPLKNQASAIEPVLHFESFILDDKDVKPDKGIISIPAGAKRLDISYTGLSFISPEQVRFKYKLEGFDTENSKPTNQRNVTYTSLPPGDYTFRFTAKTADGNWNHEPIEINIRQEAFYYQKPIFWVICGVIVVAIVLFTFWVREQNNKRRRKELELKVEERTKELKIERDKSNKLLHNILPDEIAKRLKDETNSGTVADYCPEATVLFLDIVNFTQITANVSAEDMVAALNDLFSRFDISAEQLGVEKIKTIGDAYMAVCGLPTPNPKHASIMVHYAKTMYNDLEEYNKTAKIKFQIRIGLNTGPVIAGVIGRNKFIYDLWGDTVNTASRMESICEPGKICMTESVKDSIIRCNLVEDISEKDCDVKGKGHMHIYEID